MRLKFRSLAVALALLAAPAGAQILDSGWDLDPGTSALRFQSVKKTTVFETSHFARLAGAIEPDGKAELRVALDSIDTKIDLRNVRMRFLFFETFKFPEAVVSLQLTPEILSGLDTSVRKTVTLPFDLTLHEVTRHYAVKAAVTRVAADRVSVASEEPIAIPVADYGLMDNLAKLEEAAGNIRIIPMAIVSFDLAFVSRAPGAAPAVLAALAPGEAAIEAKGALSREACDTRFATLSRTGNIYFGSGSARLESDSAPLLNQLLDIVNRCPDLTVQIDGHTDAVGSDAANLVLSQDRAQAVAKWLTEAGVPAGRMVVTGFGESRPITTNDTEQGRARNRRIEFSSLD